MQQFPMEAVHALMKRSHEVVKQHKDWIEVSDAYHALTTEEKYLKIKN